MNYLTDTHCHLYLPDYELDFNKVLNSAIEVDIKKILVPGIDYPSSKKSIELSQQYNKLYAAVGIHPNSNNITEEEISLVVSMINLENVSAIGEIGLDYFRLHNSADDQIFLFKKMLNLASEKELPICIHNRDADDDLIKLLEAWYSQLEAKNSKLIEKPGVFHSFGGSKKISRWAIDHHFYLGISGVITYQNAIDLQQTIYDLDLKHILIETDSPFLTPHPYRGQRNEPKNVELIAHKIASIKGITFEKVARETYKNANDLFGWH